MSIRVALADDHAILVAALRSMLDAEPDIKVVGTANDGAELLRIAAQTAPDVVIMDIGMPGMNGIEALQKLTQAGAAVRVIVLSGFSDKRFVLEAMSAGAAGYVVKSAAAEELPRAIRAAAQGQAYLCPMVAGSLVENLRDRGSHSAVTAPARLAPRERVIVRLLAEGRTSAQIAAELHIAPSTVDTHRRNIMRKLDLHNVSEITRYAIREGLTTA